MSVVGSFSEVGSGGCRARFSSMNGPRWQRRVRRSSQSDRVRRSSQSEGGRRKAEAIRHALGDCDPLREALNRFCGLLPDGLSDYPTGKSVRTRSPPDCGVSSPFRKNISVFQKCKSSYMICHPVPKEGRFAIETVSEFSPLVTTWATACARSAFH